MSVDADKYSQRERKRGREKKKKDREREKVSSGYKVALNNIYYA